MPEPLMLHPCAGPCEQRVVIDGARPAIIGRGGDCQVHLPDPHVSRHHALIVQRDGTWTLTDLGSRHGTFLNGMRLEANRGQSWAPPSLVSPHRISRNRHPRWRLSE